MQQRPLTCPSFKERNDRLSIARFAFWYSVTQFATLSVISKLLFSASRFSKFLTFTSTRGTRNIIPKISLNLNNSICEPIWLFCSLFLSFVSCCTLSPLWKRCKSSLVNQLSCIQNCETSVYRSQKLLAFQLWFFRPSPDELCSAAWHNRRRRYRLHWAPLLQPLCLITMAQD